MENPIDKPTTQNATPNADAAPKPPHTAWPVAVPSLGELQGKWRQQVGAAKLLWGKVTEDELLKLEGHADKLTGLIQERYALTRDAAAKQVRAFLDQHTS